MASSAKKTDAGAGINGKSGKPRKKNLMQADVPAYTAEDARKVAEALRDQYAKQPATPLQVAKAMDISPGSSTFKLITGSAVAYGFTDGVAQADRFELRYLGRRSGAPLSEGDDVVAFREAILKPRVIREFLHKYNGHKVPNRSIALNVLEDMGVPNDAADRAYDMIMTNARAAQVISIVKGIDYVELDHAPAAQVEVEEDTGDGQAADDDEGGLADVVDIARAGVGVDHTPTAPVKAEGVINNKVFITHGKNLDVVEQLKELLKFGGFEPVVSVQNETLAKSLPDKVMDDMRSCNAAVVHVGAEMTLLDGSGTEHKILNPNVLIEIGAAMALYKKRFILLVEDGTTLPSNLQGLYEARYSGGKLDYDATMKLLKTFNEFKS